VLPRDLLPTHYFSEEQIIKGLPPRARFGLKDLRYPWAAGTKIVPLSTATQSQRGSNSGG